MTNRTTNLGYFGFGKRIPYIETNSIRPIRGVDGVEICEANLCSNRLNLFKQFDLLPAAAIAAGTDPHFQLVDTLAVTFDESGRLVLNAAAAGSMLVAETGVTTNLWNGATTAGQFAPDQLPCLEVKIHTPVAFGAASQYFIGFGVDAGDSDIADSDQLLFSFVNGTDTTWQFIATDTSVAETGSPFNSGVTVAVDTNYALKIQCEAGAVAGNFIAKAYVNGQLVATTGTLSAALEVASLIIKIGDDNATGGEPAFAIQSIRISKPYN